MRVRLEWLGCRLNAAESDELARQVEARGGTVVAVGQPADLVILNSCTVTGEAGRKSRQAIRRLRRNHPDAVLVVTGCHAEMAPDEVRDLGVDLVVGNLDKDRVLERVEEAGLAELASVARHGVDVAPRDRTRAFVKVQDGCDNRCAYCVVTVARGAGRSVPEAVVVADVQRQVAAGVREVVLTGVHLGSYGKDLRPRSDLTALLEQVLEGTGVERLRLSSVEPWDVSPALLDRFTDPRLLPHLHVPLQSGCDATLRRMARRTSRAAYARLARDARHRIPDLSLSTDVMVGFPGESETEFEESIAFVEEVGFSRLHVFRFSPRPGTAAASMTDHVPADSAAARSRRMLDLGGRLQERFHRRFLGRPLRVLWESPVAAEHPATRRWSGLTGNYIRATTEADEGVDLANVVTDVEVVAANRDGVEVRVVSGAATGDSRM